jgi:aminopeptidase N
MRRTLPAVLAIAVAAANAYADTYPRQAGVDAHHYVFRLTIADDSPAITGEATAEFRLTAGGIREIVLDLTSPYENGRGMTVTDVASGGRPVAFIHKDDRLVLPLPAPPNAGAHVSFTIKYHGIPAPPAAAAAPQAGGRPANPGLRLIKNKYGEWSAFSENWPNRARQWLPMIDHPYDKATSEFIVTAPAKYQVVANGLLEEELDLGDGRRVTHWKQGVPIASWLNAIGIAQFSVHHAGRVRGVELQTWVFHQDRDAGRVYFEVPARQALDFFSERIGPYTYEKLANVQAAGLGGGTEHASAIFYGENGVRPSPNHGLVAHEIAHQWFGNAVTEADWDDVWLSEGFATYFTHLYTEHYFGRDTMVANLKRDIGRVLAFERANPGIAIVHDNLSDMRRVLNTLVYQKAGWVLHMLRGQIGTDAFWAGIREYYGRYRDANTTSANLQRIMEQASGQSLEWFFRQWLNRAGTPRVRATWRYDAAARQIEVEIAQTHEGEPYRLPLEIGITVEGPSQPGRGGQAGPVVPQTRIERIELTGRAQRFTIASDRAPLAVTLDPNTWTLMDAAFTGK